MNVTEKIKEADVYQSMGLPEEALKIYQHILLKGGGVDRKTREKAKEKILLLRKEISTRDQMDVGQISHENIDRIKEAVSNHGGIQGVLDKAEAFKELGLYREAVEEYQKLFRVNYPKKELVAEISGCLLGRYPPSDAVHKVVSIISDKAILSGKKSVSSLPPKGLKTENHP